MLYYNDENFFDAKKNFERALIRMNHMKDDINPIQFVNGLYMKGSSSYYLEEYSEAAKDYESAIKIL